MEEEENKITPLLFAVWKEDGEKIKIWINDRHPGTNSIFKKYYVDKEKYLEAETISLKTLIKKYSPTIIKCDIEGA